MREMLRTWMLAALVLPALLFTASAPAADEAPAADPEARISQLIQKLGSPHYLIRDRAQQELAQIGLPAFDLLFEAQLHDDIEIALRAKYLVRKLRITWSRDDDPQAVRRILKSYEEVNREERESRMRQLAALEGGEGTEGLCRIVRFETNEELSKRAALLVLNMTPPEEKETPRIAKLIRGQMGSSKRPAAAWLRTYSQTLTDPEATLAAWDKLSREEQDLQTRQPDQSTSKEIVRDLLRWQVSLLDRLKRTDQAVATMRRTVELIRGDKREELIDTVEWLMQRSAWAVVDDVAARFADQFAKDATLLYRLAEARLKQNQTAQAETTAAKARSLEAEDPSQHVRQAYSLQERGLFDWARREYQAAIDLGPPGSLYDLQSRFLLSEMLHDQEQSLEAAKMLQGAVDAMDKDQQVVQLVEQRMGRKPQAIRSRMHFFYAVHHGAAGDGAKQIAELDKSVAADDTDADALIARYRVAKPPVEFRETTLKMIRKASEGFQNGAVEKRRELDSQDNLPSKEYTERELATDLNQFAWLVGNTEGNFDAAVRASHRSLELRPETGGYYDTLGRCYYAKGDLANAIKYQSLANKLEPHTGEIRRQLEFFQSEAAKKR